MTAKKSTPQKKDAEPATEASTAKSGGKANSMDVTLGHIFALKPRVDRSFKKTDLPEAKRKLTGETYESLSDAARAVADEALSITRDGGANLEKRRR